MLPAKQLNQLTQRIIGCAIAVHRELGPGLLESIYVDALCYELAAQKLTFSREHRIPVVYKGNSLSGFLRLDLLVRDLVVLEIKSVEQILPVHEAQLLSYLRLARKPIGLLINFNTDILKTGIRRKMCLAMPEPSKPLRAL